MYVRDICILLILVAGAQTSHGAWVASAEQKVADRIIDATVATSYEEAFRLCDSASAETQPAFMMLKLTTIGLRDLDFEEPTDSVLFRETYSSAIAQINAYELANGASAYSKTLRGFCDGAKASFDVRLRSFGKAVGTGLDALKILDDASQDSSLADADYFLGLYDWSRADLRRRMWWMLFWLPGNRARGLARLERCAKVSIFSRTAAELALVEVYAQAGKVAQAREVLSRLQAKYPGSRFVGWAEAKLEQHLERWPQAAGVRIACGGVYPRGAWTSQRHAVHARGIRLLRTIERSLIRTSDRQTRGRRVRGTGGHTGVQ